jgi:hypothetical protein
MSPLSPGRQHKVHQIKAALGGSDAAMHHLFSQLDGFEASAKKTKTGNVSAAWLATLDKIREELLSARDRLDNLNTGLHAQGSLRRSLIATAAGVAAWRFALGSKNDKEIAAAQGRMQRHFQDASYWGRRGAIYLKQGR